MEANAEEWRRKMNAHEAQIESQIANYQTEISTLEAQINDTTTMKNEAITSSISRP
jgi:septal ring factor EnvC (AmiA/AmiB activator)